MLDFVIKYWVQFLFGLAAACFTFVIKQYYKMKEKIKDQELKETKENMCNSMKDAMYAKISEEHELSMQADKEIRKDIENLHGDVEVLTQGVLAIQGKQFIDECRRLLQHGHEITLEEYENVNNEHEVYNALGGNHHGDALFKSVMKKWNHQLNPETHEE